MELKAGDLIIMKKLLSRLYGGRVSSKEKEGPILILSKEIMDSHSVREWRSSEYYIVLYSDGTKGVINGALIHTYEKIHNNLN
jgi:hypothetical protein